MVVLFGFLRVFDEGRKNSKLVFIEIDPSGGQRSENIDVLLIFNERPLVLTSSYFTQIGQRLWQSVTNVEQSDFQS